MLWPPPELDPGATGRLQYAALHLGGGCPLHVVQLYGHADGSNEALAANEGLLAQAFVRLCAGAYSWRF